jgi:EF-P beta-lysylation protein EpmB
MLATDSALQAVPDWQQLLAGASISPRELLARLHIPPEAVSLPLAQRLDFPLRVPAPFIERMRPGDARDPLLLQVLPQALEELDVDGFSADPLAEAQAAPAAGVVHKYRGRLLLISTGACAVNCRYCFRRHFPYSEQMATGAELEQALDYIRADSSLSEVILSGGDPLVLGDRQLQKTITALEAIPHLQTLRIHSRTPVVLPQRVTPALLDMLESTRLRVVMVIHSNHANELDAAVEQAMQQLRGRGLTLLNQSVLLRGVNDSVEVLARLSQRLFECGVLPYYLHLLDPVAGAAHFDLPERRARVLHDQLAALLPGYLLPRLVREEPGAPGKRSLAPHSGPDAM